MDRTGWVQVTSSTVDAIAWRKPPHGPGVLSIRFKSKNGSRMVFYDYTKKAAGGTPRQAFHDMLGAPSKGVWLHRTIKLNVGAWIVDGPYLA